jgi:hypothetical protein
MKLNLIIDKDWCWDALNTKKPVEDITSANWFVIFENIFNVESSVKLELTYLTYVPQ